MEVARADPSDLHELAKSFFQLGIVELVNVQTNEITPTLPPPEGSTGSNDPSQDHSMREGTDFHANATPAFVETRFKENPGRNPRRARKYTMGEDHAPALASIRYYTQPGYYRLQKYRS
ncbi:UNVERIFIED_CONTAM: hypothetical protein Sradi_0181400 [Sesamum radiatum]|uniref:Uncharacterized protein n=1 Tax=Sesamum radiatum TaxID=300843 RepID=A0AAW2W0T7_SESRA